MKTVFYVVMAFLCGLGICYICTALLEILYVCEPKTRVYIHNIRGENAEKLLRAARRNPKYRHAVIVAVCADSEAEQICERLARDSGAMVVSRGDSRGETPQPDTPDAR